MKHLMILLLLLIAFLPILSADGTEPHAWEYLKSYPQSVGSGITAPYHWEAKEWITTSSIIALMGAAYVVDEEIRTLFQRNRSEFSNSVMIAAKQFGEGKYVLPAIGITVLSGYAFDSPKTIDSGFLSLKSFIIANGITQVVKLTTQRKRPSANSGKQFFNGSGFSRKRDSFPSGHTTIVWSIAPILVNQYRENLWVAPSVYTIATLTSLSRVHDDNHWFSDVLAGAAIGYFSAKLVLKTTPTLHIYPNSQINGFSLSWCF